MFNKKTIEDIDLSGKRVLLRADYNVPLDNDGHITDDYRLQQSLPTLQYLLKAGAKLMIISHLGRPDGKPDPKLSLKPVADRLAQLLKKPVGFVVDCIGEEVKQAAKNLKDGQVVLLENLRFHPEEEKNDDQFAAELAANAELFVQDGFGVVHRAHASTEAITHHLPSVAGFLLAREVDVITNVMHQPKRPLVAIIGGAKIADKIEILNRFIEISDFVAIGGAMANTFLKAEGIKVAKSKIDEGDLPHARAILARAKAKAAKTPFIFYLPQDAVVAEQAERTAKTRIVDWSAHVIAEIEAYPKRAPASSGQIKESEMILDIGPFSGAFIAGGIQLAATVVWNGTMGVTETTGLQGPIGPFAHGTELVVEAMLGQFGRKPFSLVGGGDTVGYVESRKLTQAFNHVSTGGGASLELMAGHKLPGVESLLDK